MNLYITTAIDYPNALPHNGTAFEKIGADIQARFRRFCGDRVFLLLGNDENTQKSIKATPEGQTTQEYLDGIAGQFRRIWDRLGISYTDFIQTSEPRHRAGVEQFIRAVFDAGYIYKKAFTSPYCDGCEEFKSPRTLVNGQCPNHQSAVHDVAEENYFFRLSAFKDRLLEYFDRADVRPAHRLTEVRNFVADDLEDVSISRVNQGWGIPVPWDQGQVIYVWFDALLAYLTGVGFGTDPEKFLDWWPADVHVIGKDITRFHCVLWPAMLMAYSEVMPLPIQVFSHGFIYQDGVKESKSNPAAVSLAALLDEYGPEAYRYIFMSRCPFDGDGEYSAVQIRDVYNAGLANNLGNLVSRTVNMIVQYGAGRLPAGSGRQWVSAEDVRSYRERTEAWDYRAALAGIWHIFDRANKYIEDQKPWALAKTDPPRCLEVLREVVAALRAAAIMLGPYMPETAGRLHDIFQYDFGTEWADLVRLGADNYVEIGEITVRQGPPLFPRK